MSLEDGCIQLVMESVENFNHTMNKIFAQNHVFIQILHQVNFCAFNNLEAENQHIQCC